MLSSKVLVCAERNVRHSVYKGQNGGEIWGGVPVVLLFGDDYQLFPVIKEGAIPGYSKKKLKVPQTPTAKTPASQLFLSKRKLSIHTCHVGNCIHTQQKIQSQKQKVL